MASNRADKTRSSTVATTPGAVSCFIEDVALQEAKSLTNGSSNHDMKSSKDSSRYGRDRYVPPRASNADSKLNEADKLTDKPQQPLSLQRTRHNCSVSRIEEPEPLADSLRPRNERRDAQRQQANIPGITSMRSSPSATASHGKARPTRVKNTETIAHSTSNSVGSAHPGARAIHGGDDEGLNALVRRKDPRAHTSALVAAGGRNGNKRSTDLDLSDEGGTDIPDTRVAHPGAQRVSRDMNTGQDAAARRKDPRAHAQTLVSAAASRLPDIGSEQVFITSRGGTREDENLEGRKWTTKNHENTLLKKGENEKSFMDIRAPQLSSPDSILSGRNVVNVANIAYRSTGGPYDMASCTGYVRTSLQGLAVAVPIENEEEDFFLHTAFEYDPDAKPPLYKNRRFRLYVMSAFVLLFVVIAVVVIMEVVMNGTESGTYSPTETPTSSPTSSEESLYRQEFVRIVGDQVMTPGTPHDRATRWIMEEDTFELEFEAPDLLQRFILALFYFITTSNESAPWPSCNRPMEGQEDECVFERFVRGSDGESLEYVPEPATSWLSGSHECNWIGVICDDETQIIRALQISGQNISGTLPTEITELRYLQSISLSYNHFTGTLPVQWAFLKHLMNLEVHGNMLTGTIPSAFFSADSLQNINILDNDFSGTIPSSIGLLSNLKGLHCSNNRLSGSFPTEIGNLSYLAYTRFDSNRLNGTIPSEIGRLSLLHELWLDGNFFTGMIPTEIGLMTDMEDIILFNNNWTGPIPEELYSLSYLTRLFVFNSPALTGTISTRIGNLTNLVEFAVKNTGLTGTIPTELGLLTNLILGSFSQTQLTGTMPFEVCKNKGNGILEYLQADCSATDLPAMVCACCFRCCNRETQVCI